MPRAMLGRALFALLGKAYDAVDPLLKENLLLPGTINLHGDDGRCQIFRM